MALAAALMALLESHATNPARQERSVPDVIKLATVSTEPATSPTVLVLATQDIKELTVLRSATSVLMVSVVCLSAKGRAQTRCQAVTQWMVTACVHPDGPVPGVIRRVLMVPMDKTVVSRAVPVYTHLSL